MKTILAAAQIAPWRNDFAGNLARHLSLIEIAADRGASVIVFPEMSLTGYERELAGDHAFEVNDERLTAIAAITAQRDIIALAGGPVRIGCDLYIGCLIFGSSGATMAYTKKYLHEGEELFFSTEADNDPILDVRTERLACAVCYDIENSEHPRSAVARNATVYCAGIFYSPTGVQHAHEVLQSHAQRHSMAVVMANFCGRSWNMQAGGRSAIWSADGTKLAEASECRESLLFGIKNGTSWSGDVLEIS
jgi:predicted amidohydrolase